MKKLRLLSLLIIFIMIFTTIAYGIDININGTNVKFTEQTGNPFVDSNNRTQVPLRVTMESFGAKVDWVQSTQTAIVEKDGIKVEVPIGKSYIIKNGQQIPNDTVAQIKNGKTYLPIRVVLEAFGAKVGWDNVNQAVKVIPDGLEKLTVHFIDVGQADCILINANDEFMLIDAGNNEDSNTIISYLKAQGVKTLKYVIATHPHEDHIGSLDDVIDTFEIKNIIMPSAITTTNTFEDVLTAIENKGLLITEPVVGDTYKIGKAEFTIIAPNKEYEELNNASVGIKLVNGKNSFVLCGDAEELSENDILKNGIDIKADVLKLSHHGSDSSSSVKFLDAVSTTYAVIMVGKDNSYGHPDSEIIKKMIERNIKTYRTDEQGTIIVSSDGESITVNLKEIDLTKEISENQGGNTGTTTPNNKVTYILNTNSKKFHYPTCSSVKLISPENYKEFFGTRQDAINQGYDSCGRCNP